MKNAESAIVRFKNFRSRARVAFEDGVTDGAENLVILQRPISSLNFSDNHFCASIMCRGKNIFTYA